MITQLDHEANRGPWLTLRERGDRRPGGARSGRTARLDYEDMARQIGPRTRMVAMGLSSNALGTVNDAALARRLTRGPGAWLVLDAVHYAPHFPIDVTALDADYLLCSAYKFYGPHVGHPLHAAGPARAAGARTACARRTRRRPSASRRARSTTPPSPG